jgi:hypothetical protein
MNYERLAYDDAASTSEMASDATRVGLELRRALRPYAVRSNRREGDPATGTPEVSDELAERAAALELHLG